MSALQSGLFRLFLVVLAVCASVALEGSRGEKLIEVQSLVYDAQMGNAVKSLDALQQIVFKSIDPTYHGLVVKAGALPILVRQLQVGSEEAKLAACTALGGLTANDDDRLKISETKAVESLLVLLNDLNVELRLASLQTLGNLMQDQVGQQQLTNAGGANQLVSLLSDQNEQIRRVAAGTIGNIAIQPEYIPTLVAAGCVVELVDLLRQERAINTDPQTAEVTLGALRNLVQLDEPLVAMIEAGSALVLENLFEDESNTEDSKVLANELLDFMMQYEGKIETVINQQDEL